MMFDLRVEKTNGESLTLTQKEDIYQVIDIQGLNPPKAQVNITPLANIDGGQFNSAKLDTRNIVVIVRINGDAERNRIALYDFFPTKTQVKLFYKNDTRDIFAEGIVESVECTAFAQSEICQISIVCPDSYLHGVEEIVVDISDALAMFEFPFFINQNEPIPFSEYANHREINVRNESNAETGVEVQLDFMASVNTVEIKNVETGEYIKLSGSYQDADRIIITTGKGEKKVRLIRNGVESNIFAQLVKGSTFFQLYPGDNIFSYLADNGASNDKVFILFSFHERYRGV